MTQDWPTFKLIWRTNSIQVSRYNIISHLVFPTSRLKSNFHSYLFFSNSWEEYLKVLNVDFHQLVYLFCQPSDIFYLNIYLNILKNDAEVGSGSVIWRGAFELFLRKSHVILSDGPTVCWGCMPCAMICYLCDNALSTTQHICCLQGSNNSCGTLRDRVTQTRT